MLFMTKQIMLDFKDLRFIEITCSICKTKTTLDATSPKARPPGECSACGSSFNRVSVQDPVTRFIDVYRLLSDAGQTATFRVIVDDSAS